MPELLAVAEVDSAAPVKAGSGKFGITILKAGQGSSGYYPADVLERDGAKTFPKGTHVYLDHPSEDDKYNRPERSVRDLAGVLSEDASYDGTSQSLTGSMQIVPMYAALVESLAPFVGMSIRALAYAENAEVGGVMVNKVSQLVHGQSVDIVTRAGAGGQITSMIESARNVVPANPPVPVGTPKERNNMELSKEDFTSGMAEMTKALLALGESLKPAPASGGDPLDAMLGLASALSTSGLNEAAQKLVIESVKHGAVPTDAIAAHKAAFSVPAPVAHPVAPATDAYGQIVGESDRRFGLGYGEQNGGGNRAAVVGGQVVEAGVAGGDASQLSEAEKKDFDAVITRMVKNGRSF